MSLYCRVCKFKNVCYHPKIEEWFIIKTNASVFHNLQSSSPKVTLIAIQNHSSFNWEYSEISQSNPAFQNIKVRHEKELHFLQSRLIPDNVMHILHDNAIGLYHLLKRLRFGDSLNEIVMDHRILMIDGHLLTTATKPLTYLSNKPMRFISYLHQDRDVVTCFQDLVVGNSESTTWYQYGFDVPQGPIKDKTVSGYPIREFSNLVLEKIMIPFITRHGMLFIYIVHSRRYHCTLVKERKPINY